MSTGSTDRTNGKVAIQIMVAVLVRTTIGSAEVVIATSPVLLLVLHVVILDDVDFCSGHGNIVLLQVLDVNLSNGRIKWHVPMS